MMAGKLRHRVTIEQAVESQSSSGETAQTWNTFAEVWASINPVHGRETWRAAQVTPLLTHAIKIRGLAGITPKMRVRFDDPKVNATRYFGIDSIMDVDEQGNEMNLLCIEDLNG